MRNFGDPQHPKYKLAEEWLRRKDQAVEGRLRVGADNDYTPCQRRGLGSCVGGARSRQRRAPTGTDRQAGACYSHSRRGNRDNRNVISGLNLYLENREVPPIGGVTPSQP
jgi:hypothetical protein